MNNLTKLSNDLNISDCVRFCGYVDDVDHKIRDASIYVSTSNYEGISNSMIEALAMGIPTICTDCPVGGASLMIKNNVNGILIPVGGKDELYDSIVKLINDENFARKIGKEGLKVKKDYSITSIVNMWEDCILRR